MELFLYLLYFSLHIKTVLVHNICAGSVHFKIVTLCYTGPQIDLQDLTLNYFLLLVTCSTLGPLFISPFLVWRQFDNGDN